MQATKYEIALFVVFITLIIVGLLATAIWVIYYFVNKQSEVSISIGRLKGNYERDILLAQIEMQEYTFEQISREVHDNISSSLCLLKLQLSNLDINNKEVLTNQVNWSTELLSHSLNDLNAISKGLNRELIQNKGLIAATEAEVNRIRKLERLAINLRVEGEAIFMDNNKELVLFRIVQEGLNNILKHSKALHAELVLKFSDTDLCIKISDDGIGLPSADLLNKKVESAGLINMRSRAESYGGNLKILPTNSGTSLLFTIPYQHGNSDK